VGAGSETIALTHVALIDGSQRPPVHDATIIVRAGRIDAVGPSKDISVPPGARTLNLRGAFVIPGFVDTHYHVTTAAMRYHRTSAGALDSSYDRALAERLLRVALAFGITAIRDPGASPIQAAITLREDIARGTVLGPRMRTAGTILKGWDTPDSVIRASVRAQAAAGVDYIKVYSSFSPHQVSVAVDEAHRHRLDVIGHLQRTSWTEAARAGVDFIAHGAPWHESYLAASNRQAFTATNDMRQRIAWYEGVDLAGPAMDTLLNELTTRGVSVDPTLVAYHTKFWWRDSVYQRDPDVALVPEEVQNWKILGMPTAGWSDDDFDRVQRGWARQLDFVRLMHNRGVLLTAGSDLASPWVIPGVGYHQELALLVSAGLSPSEVLRIATRNGARSLGLDAEVGTIEPGKRADLVVLQGDPGAAIANTRRIAWVMHGGTLHRPKDLLAER
jgi:imidazolonepropionase-like amidohydrolase